jgi:Zn-dependent M28 family amino/carboxypeptidase
MRLIKIVLVLTALAFCSCAQTFSPSAPPVSGERAMAHVRAQVALGPRPPGSPELQRCREYIAAQMKSFGYEIEEDVFIADTPYGPVEMKNLIARRSNSKEGKGVIVLASHYDTKLMKGKNFVGANDAGSSTGLLIELGRVLADASGPYDYWFVFFDGEEAFVEWSAFDSTYGSRNLARKWKEDGTASKIGALVLLDMIGDKDLDIIYDTNSTKALMDLVWETAKNEGLESILSRHRGPIEDDHIPFLGIGVPSVDIIDLNYGPGNSYWHTNEDTLDKISAESMEKVGRLVLALLSRLQKESILDRIARSR